MPLCELRHTKTRMAIAHSSRHSGHRFTSERIMIELHSSQQQKCPHGTKAWLERASVPAPESGLAAKGAPPRAALAPSLGTCRPASAGLR